MVFVHRSIVPASPAELFAWHERPEALVDLAPSRRWFRIEQRRGGLRDGDTVTFSIGIGPLRLHWTARHFGYIRNEQFCDEQIRGPFAVWTHRHRMEAIKPNESAYEDRVEYALPGGPWLNRLAAPVVRTLLTRMFERRHAIVRRSVGHAS